MKVKYNCQREAKQNPFIGLTSFQHFDGDELYSDLVVLPENNLTETEHVECYPVPAYVKQKGRSQGYYPNCSVAYIRILWKEFEPREEKYNFAFIGDILKKAKENNQSLMFRLMPHSTRESDDVPDWLKEKIPCPIRPKGKRVKDSPRDERFLYYFGRAIRAFGESFDKDPALFAVDISLPGAWGEGCDIGYFNEDKIKEFSKMYADIFKNTLLISQIGAPWIVDFLSEEKPVGWRADCIGPDHTYKMMLPLTERLGDAWKKGHVSFESYWWLGEWKRKGWDIDILLERMLDWHVSTFNAKFLPIPFEWKDKIDSFVAKMGYHFVIKEAEAKDVLNKGEDLSLSLVIENVGVAPIYNFVPLFVRLKGEKELLFKTELDIRKWLPGESKEEINIHLPENMAKGKYRLQIGIGDNEISMIYFASDAKPDGHFFELFEVEIK